MWNVDGRPPHPMTTRSGQAGRTRADPGGWLSFSPALVETALGGTEVYVHRLAAALRNRGVDVTLAAYGPGADERRVDGFRVLRIPGPPVPSRWERWSCEPTRLREFAALVADVRPTVVHFHGSLHANAPEFLATARSAGAKVLWTFHAPGNTCLQTALLRAGREPCDGFVEPGRCARCTLASAGLPGPLASAFAALDLGGVARAVPARLRHPFEVRRGAARFRARLDEALALVDLHLTHAAWSRELLSRNGVPAARVRSLSLPPPALLPQGSVGADPPSSKGPFRLLFAGRYIDIKGLHLLAEALRGPLRDEPDLALTILGAPGVQAYERRVRELLAGDARVRFGGAATPDEVLSAMGSADAVVVPSTWLETGPYTVLEAQWMGAAVVGAALGGIAERLRDDPHGHTFPRGDVEGLAAAVRRARERRLDGTARATRIDGMRRALVERFEGELGALLGELARG